MTHARNQDGFALIEVIVSAAVLALIALAVLSGIDGATASTARERARAVAASLAEQDQERMRSIRFDKLATVPQAAPVNIDGVSYKIVSEATWVTDDANATPACGDKSTKQAEYLRIVTTVTSAMVGARIAPVRIESLVAPSVTYAQGHGTLAVKVVSGDVSRAAGTVVTAVKDGGGTVTATANAEGCALFRSIDVGDYTVRLNRSGYIDKKGNQLSETDATVSPNIINVLSMPYDKAVSMDIAITTLKPGTPMSTAAPRFASKFNAVSDNAAETSVLRTFAPSPVAMTSSIKATNLFPFSTEYSYFTGKCAYESPVKANVALNNTYFTTAPTSAASVLGDPAKFQPQPATVHQPALNIRIRASYNTPAPTGANVATFDASGLKVSAWLQKIGTDTCTDVQGTALSVQTWPGGAWGDAPLSTLPKNWVSQPGTFDPGLPFGTYRICLNDGIRWWSKLYDNTKAAQETTVELPPATTVAADWKTNKADVGC